MHFIKDDGFWGNIWYLADFGIFWEFQILGKAVLAGKIRLCWKLVCLLFCNPPSTSNKMWYPFMDIRA
jgi:hypothetical protein